MDKQSILASRKSKLTPEQLALLEKRLAGKGGGDGKQVEKPVVPSIPRRAADAPVPVAFAQTGFWFRDQLEPGNTAYNTPYAVRLSGDLQVELLERSFHHVFQRHESLRTTFHLIDGEPRQVVNTDYHFELPLIDLSALSSEERAAEIKRLQHLELEIPFNLETGPLLRASLLKESDREHMMLMTMHHIVTDGWSLALLIGELAKSYEAFTRGAAPVLPELPIQYPDYTIWQQDYLQGEVYEKHMNYWKEKLAGNIPVLQLPTDYPRPAVQTFNGKLKKFTLPKSLVEGLNKFSQQEGASLYMTLLSAFNTLLYRYSGQDDIAVGTLIAGRNRKELENLIGVFINNLVMRSSVTPEMTFRELLVQVRKTSLDAFAHQDLPFEKLVEEIQPNRDLSHTPLFQVMFILQNQPMASLELPNLTLSPIPMEREAAKFDLLLEMLPNEDGSLEAMFEYSTDLFAEETMDRMSQHLLRLLDSILANPNSSLIDLPIISADERTHLLHGWNDTAKAYDTDLLLHQHVEAQVERTPDADAVTFEGETISYRELNNRANRLAHFLKKQGVGPEVMVGVCMERSLGMVISLVGILKAGGAYVPLDPTLPGDRLAYMMEDSDIPVLLTQAHIVDRLPEVKAPMIILDSEISAAAGESTENPTNDMTMENIAYMIYTSGTTGKPKGVPNTHIGISNRLQWMQDMYQLTSADRILQKTPYSFDVSVWEFFWPLMYGATLVVARPEGHKDGAYLVDLIHEQAVTTLHFVPSMLQVFLEQEGLEEKCTSIRQVMCSGEALPYEAQEKFFSRLGAKLHNLYGPTEAAVDVTYWECQRGSDRLFVPIGRPVANTQMYILDEKLQPVPLGVAGELHIGGIQLARGYHNRPELTAEKFIPNPHGEGRLYKTGDLARFLPDGNIQYLGRLDHQVKIRGFRIELGEIEALLDSHEAVGESVVVAREDVPGDKRLVAYVTSKIPALDVTVLRDHLREALPEYMVPSAFVVLDKMPLSPNGKLDRKALPKPDLSALGSTVEYVAPRNETEEQIIAIWSDILKQEGIGVLDNFFERGGHSLLATQVVSRLNKTFGLRLPLRALFEALTVESLSRVIHGALGLETSAEHGPIEKADRDAALPLSFAQQRLWVLDQYMPNSTAYNLPMAVRFSGKLNVEALEKTLNEIVRRHEALRTTFAEVEGQPVQVIAEPSFRALQVTDLRALPEGEREAEMQRLVQLDADSPFDLGHGPLIRSELLQVADDEHVLLLNIHHIVSDGWSTGVLIQEAAVLYAAFREDQASPLPELEVQYADYAQWQRNWLQGDVLEGQLSYWKNQLGGLEPLQLPTDHPRPAVQTYNGAKESFTLSRELTTALQTLSQRREATLFMTLLAGFQTLLHRYTGQDDIAVGTPIAGRSRAELEDMIGFFVNTLVMRTDLSGTPTFADVLKRVREASLGAFAHQDVPFEKLVEELNVERDPSRTPLFQVMFSLQNWVMSEVDLTDLTLAPVEFETNLAKFDLTLTLLERPDGIAGSFEYNTDLFEAATIRRMIGHFETLLNAIAAAPELPLGELELLTAPELEQVLVEWNRSTTEYPRHATVQQLFEEQAQLTPDATALVFEDATLTYRELNERTNQLAHRLRKLGVEAQSCVAISAERSADAIVGMLAILKAGGAYVPLDPAYPQDRLTFMLEDSGANILITQERLKARFADQNVQMILLDTDREALEQEDKANPTDVNAAEHMAYIIYTSGSTGKPKGVCVPHRGIVRLVRNTNYVPFAEKLRFAQVSNTSFDAATFEIWGALLNGGQLIGISKEIALNPDDFAKEIKEQGITAMFLTTSLFNQMAKTEPTAFRTVDHVLVGGEQMDVRWSREVLKHGAPKRLVNGYGPTESTTFAAWFEVKELAEHAYNIPIGQPLSNTTLYVLDRNLKPVPVGVPGELLIGGDGLANGYLNRDDLTAEKFIPHPFGAEGERLYKTGDLVRWLPDGTIECLGRIDDQVKIRGFRIELGEIETLLGQHPGVRELAVIAREDQPGDKRLVAYLVPRVEAPTSAELRSFLKETMPDYMVPSAFVFLESLPITANGKLDRRALPMPEGALEPDEAYVAPRNETETTLAEIWSDILRVQVGAVDNFFELGGHSLLATQVISRLNTAFGLQIPLRSLFENPTVEGMAEVIAAMQGEGAGHEAPIAPIGRDGELDLSFAQQRLLVIDQLLPGSSLYNMAFAVRLVGELNAAALTDSLNEIVRRHESLRTTFVETAPGRTVQVIAPFAPLPVAQVDLRGTAADAREAEAKRLVQAEAERAFDLAAGPLVTFLLIQLADREHILMWNMHHIISDGWSTGVFVREIAALYEAFANGEASPLVDLPIQYADYAHWQRNWLQGDVLEGQLSYWKDQLGGLEPLQLPTDRPRPAVQTYNGATESFTLSRELTTALNTLSQRREATLFMTLLAGFQTLLHRYTGQDDIAVGTPIAGRNRAELEDLIGFFVNTLVLRTDLSGAPTFADLLQRVRDTSLGAFAHQDVPFEKLVEELKVERDMSRSPLFQVMFSLQNALISDVELTDLTLSPVEYETNLAKFDLTLTLLERPEGLVGSFEYNTDLFEAATIRRMIGHFETLLNAIVEAPELPLGELELLTAPELEQMLVEWNRTTTEYPRHATVQQLFEEQAQLTPDATALVFEDATLTYLELNERANQLAHRLRKLGVEAQSHVAISAERSADAIVGMLGILKSGGAYVPLDPAYPQDRLTFMLEDSAANILVTQERLKERFADQNVQLILLDTDREALEQEDKTNPTAVSAAEHTAYIIYTSGSTGQPKGVCTPHHGIVRLVRNTNYVPFEEKLRFAQVSNTSFDAATFEIWGALLNGGQLIGIAKETALNPQDFAKEIKKQGITALFLTTALFNQMMKTEPTAFQTVEHLLVGGELMDVRWVREMMKHGAPKRFMNVYGPTETTTYATWFEVKEVGEDTHYIPIGEAISNTTLYVLDSNLKPVPVGVPGELLIGGDGVANGYLNREDLTAEKFIPHPFGAEGERLYKTGDLVRWLPGGNIDILGRIDHQVKIRGFRIELGEIETLLAQHPGVRELIVIAREDQPGDKRIVAYLVPREEAPTSSELRSFLKEQMPDYMVPSAFVFLESLPITANGKIDRRALPMPEGALSPDEAYVAPRTETETTLAAIWGDILRVQVGAVDNFFELGGHSLLATQAVSRMNEAFGVTIPLRAMFETPTLEELALLVDSLHGTEASVAVPLTAIARDEALRLSYAQQRLWLLDRLVPGTAAYNMPFAIRLEGTLSITAMEDALNTIVERHESLRTTFLEQDGEPVQVIHAAARMPLAVVELSTLPAAEREQEVQRLFRADAEKPFDLTAGPLVRFSLLKTSEAEHVLLLNMHHIISDGWSMDVFTRELTALYTAFVSEQPYELPALTVQYADFASWQRDWLAAGEMERQLGYWKEKLGGELPVLQLSTDRPRPPVQTHRGAEARFELPANLTDSLKSLSREHEATLFMTLLAGFNALLYRYTGQDDLVVGTPIAGRNRQETEALIGFFVNSLALRTDLTGNPTLLELLDRVRETALAAYAHQDVPFEKLVEELGVERDLSRTPLFQVMFTLQTAGAEALELPGLTLSPLAFTNDQAKFDLSLTLFEGENGLEGSFNYNVDLFDAETIERMAGHYVRLLDGIAADPQQRISELAMLTQEELNSLAGAELNVEPKYASQALAHELFEAQAERTPDATAIVFEDRQLTYRELNERANRLAHHLQAHGVGPDVRVTLFLERTEELVVGLLGILKAGGGYVPLDTSYPEERIALIFEDSKAPVLVTQASLLERLPSDVSSKIVCLDRDAEEIAVHPATNPARTAAPENLAYMIYTSGSTGRPKAVMVEHRNLVGTLGASQQHFGFNESDVMPWIASVAFDIALFELMNPLLGGGTTVVLAREHFLNLTRLVTDLEGYTMIHTVPSLMRSIVQTIRDEERDIAKYDGLRKIYIGGDAVPPDLLDIMHEVFRSAQIHVLYGPTEGTIICAQFPVPRSKKADKLYIGSQMNHAALRLYDGDGNLVPLGVPGELYIGGPAVTRGYYERQDLTEEKYVVIDGQRWYRTGDLMRSLTDGTLEFLGRIDGQVKIRGFRIELGEIEALLTQHPSVEESVVIVRDFGNGDKRLVGYVAVPAQDITGSELRTHLKSKLPDYMVPSAILVLETLPLNPNGKIDRKALPVPDEFSTERDVAYVAPRDEVENQLVALWESLLGVSNVGVKDNFFTLGGHSLLAVRAMAEVQKTFGQQLSLASFYRGATIEELADLLRTGGEGAQPEHPSLVRLNVGTAQQQPLFLVHPAGGNIQAYMDIAREMGDRPLYALKARGLEDGLEPLSRVEDMAAYYVEAIRSVKPEGPYLIGGWSMGGAVAYEVVQQLKKQGDDTALLFMFDTPVPHHERQRALEEREEIDFVFNFINEIANIVGLDASGIQARKAELTEEQALQAFLTEAERTNALPPDFGLEQLKNYFEVYKANGKAYRTYVPEAGSTPITLFAAFENELMQTEGETYGWEALVPQVSIYIVPGNHHSMMQQPNVRLLARQLQIRLTEIENN